jgi:hypothetical protein
MKSPRFDAKDPVDELFVTGAFVYDPDGFDRALELLASPGSRGTSYAP